MSEKKPSHIARYDVPSDGLAAFYSWVEREHLLLEQEKGEDDISFYRGGVGVLPLPHFLATFLPAVRTSGRKDTTLGQTSSLSSCIEMRRGAGR